MKIIDRLSEYIEYKNISLNAFDKSIEASNGYIGRQIKNKASVGGDIIEKISCTYPDLNLEWLITGKGSMLKNQPDVLPLASDPQVQYGKQNDEIRYLKKIIENQQKELDNKQKIIENQQKIIDKQFNTIEAYAKGKIINVSDVDAPASKKGVG
jgi:hypothetical protein